MVKIGPAFYDSVNTEKIGRRRSSSSFVPNDILLIVPLFFLLLAVSVIGLRLFYIQVVRADYYKGLADDNRTRTELIPAPRGIIYDRKGNPLVANSPYFKKGDEKGEDLATQDALKMMSENKKVESEVRRDYIYKDTFAHVVGYVGQLSEEEASLPDFSDYGLNDVVGKGGLEMEYEKRLHGVNGKKLFEVDSNGNFVRELGVEEPIPGENLKTTLDVDIQKSVQKALEKVDKGAAVVSNPNTGGILAIYSAPSFDPNLFTFDEDYRGEGKYKTRDDVLQDVEDQPLLDRAISGSYPPGSTFKLVSAAAGLEEGAVTEDTLVEDTGILKVNNFSFGNWYFLQYGKTDGMVNVVDAVKRSNDIYFYKLAEKTGVDNISSWAQKFNLGKKLGVDLPGEVSGTVPTVEWKQDQIGEPWYLGDTFNYGIGQGYLLSTPLQVNAFTNVFANGGTLYRPYLVDGKNNKIATNLVSKKTLGLVRKGMMEACETTGVAWPFFDFKVKNERLQIDDKDFIRSASDSADMVRVKVGCKTGTAEIGGAGTNPHAWITVFAPFYNPEISVTVLVENGGEGSSVAGPIAKEILTDYFEKK